MALDLDHIVATFNHPANSLPPVERWQPSVSGSIDIVIDEQMQWFHEGGIFQRPALMKLLSSILRIENGDYFLVTPAEKLRIQVVDVPFKIVAMLPQDDAIILITHTEDRIRLEASTFWQLRSFHGVNIPYVEVRNGLFARVDRSVFYQMVESAELNDAGDKLLLRSAGCSFLLGDIAENS